MRLDRSGALSPPDSAGLGLPLQVAALELHAFAGGAAQGAASSAAGAGAPAAFDLGLGPLADPDAELDGAVRAYLYSPRAHAVPAQGLLLCWAEEQEERAATTLEAARSSLQDLKVQRMWDEEGEG